jgi:hypothetical protein
MMGIRIVLILFVSIAALTYVNEVDSQSKGTMIGLSVGMFIIAIICIAAFVLSVSIPSYLFLFMLYLYYLSGGYYQIYF